MKDRFSVLIIEDEADMAFILRTQLGKRYQTNVVQTLGDAVAFLRDHRPDVVLLDNNLPDGLGLYFLPTIFAYSDKSAVIMMSALHSSSLEKDAIEQGALAFLEKPFNMEDVKATIQRIEYGKTA
jgi:DNA-binding response OmpR family regulator